VRWYCNVNCHRYERPQRGRVREHWQINVDIFGSDSPNADIEIFSVVHDMMAAVGATRDMYVLRANDRVLLESILTQIVGIPADRVRAVCDIIDRWEKAPRDQLRADAAGAGLSDVQFDRLEATLAAGEDTLAKLPPDVLDRSHLAKILRSDANDLVTFDPHIVRAFEYYTSTVFEVFDLDPANSRSLFGGGRYDDLVGLFSSQRIPGVGFAVGDVTLPDFLETHGLLPQPRSEADVAVIPVTGDLAGAARDVARQLRRAGWRTSVPVEVRRLGREIARADRAGVRAIVIIGPGEWAEGQVTVRNMTTGEQQLVAAASVTEAVALTIGKQAP